MPALSRCAIRAALLALVLGASLGAWMLGAPAFGGEPPWSLLPLHLELLLVGWLMQFALGVAYWVLPRRPGAPSERGRLPVAVAAFILLDLGLLLAGFGPLLSGAAMVAAGRACEAAAAACFLVHAWPRVRPVVVAVSRGG